MTRTSTALIRLSIATIVGGAALLWSGQLPLDSQSSLVSSAEARIGRPLTPMSYAGVARRTTRRAVGLGPLRGWLWARRLCMRRPGVCAGRGCIRTNRHRMSVKSPCRKPVGAQATAPRCIRWRGRAARRPSRTVESS